MFVMFKLFYLSCLPYVLSLAVTDNIVRAVTDQITDLSTSQITEKIDLHYKLLGLMDKNGRWLHPYFNKFPTSFPRDNVTNQTLVQLVNQMAENAIKNPYIVGALKTIETRNFPTLQAKLRQEGKAVIPIVITLAFVLEKITTAMKHNWRFLKLCNKIWSKYDNLLKIVVFTSTQGNLFSVAKALSIEEVIKRLLQAFEAEHPNKSLAINSLVVNILEAVREDERLYNFDNAEAGVILAKFPHSREYNQRTGSGPCHLSRSRQFFECPQPLTLHWADLYSSWNLAFVSEFPDFVYYIPKLLIPSVSDYQDNPAGYIYTRILALYTYIHWKMNWNHLNQNRKIQWSEASLTKTWGTANKISSQDYVERLAAALSTSTQHVEAVPRPNFVLGLKKFIWQSVLPPKFRG